MHIIYLHDICIPGDVRWPATVCPMDVVDRLSRRAACPPARVWALLATPACWPAWAPHIAHVTADGDPHAPATVRPGQRLRLHPPVPGLAVAVTVTDVDPDVSWAMRADLPLGRMWADHVVTGGPSGTTVALTLRWGGPVPVGAALLRAYRPLAGRALDRLVALAEGDEAGAAANRLRMCGRPPLAMPGAARPPQPPEPASRAVVTGSNGR